MSEIRRYGGITEETEFGQNPAPDAHVHLDISSSSLDVPGDTNIIYDGGARRTARLYRPGFYAPAGNIVYGLDIRTIGWFLKWALGNYKFTTGGGEGLLNLHEFYGTESTLLPSFCARIGKDIFEHVFSGCTVNSLEINVGNELCMATVDIVAQKDSKAALEAGALQFPIEYPLAFHEVTAFLIGGDEISTEIQEFTLTIANNVAADQGRHIGSRFPARVPASERQTTLSLTRFHENTDMLEKLWGAQEGPANEGSTEYGLRLELDSGEHGKLIITMPKIINTSVQQQPSSRDMMTQPVEIRALMTELTLDDGTVEGEVLCSLDNNEDEMDVEGT